LAQACGSNSAANSFAALASHRDWARLRVGGMASETAHYEPMPEPGQAEAGAGAEPGRFYLKDAQADIRMGFVRKVYGILSAQLVLTAMIATPIMSMGKTFAQQNVWLAGVSSVFLLSTICAMMCCQDLTKKFPQNYALLTIFTIAEGVLVGFTAAAYTWQSVALAAGVTALVFLSMTAYAWNTKTDFTGFAPYLVGALLALLCFGFVISILNLCGVPMKGALMLYDLAGVLLFTMYIVFDTQMIIGGSHQVQFEIDDYVFAALNLYLDIINMFIYLLELFGDRR